MVRILIRGGSRDIRPLIMVPYKEMPSYARYGVWFYTTIKTQKFSESKVHIIHPNFGTLEL